MLGTLAMLSISLGLFARQVIEAFTIPLHFSWVEMVRASVSIMVDEVTNTVASNFETKMKFARIFMKNSEVIAAMKY